MDIWIVAAAAGAGYIAQHWKDLSRGWQDFPSSSTQGHGVGTSENPPIKRLIPDKDCSFHSMVSKKKGEKDIYVERESSSRDDPAIEVASNRVYDGENLAVGTSMSSLAIGNMDDNLQDGVERVSHDIDEANWDLSLQPSKGNIDLSYGLAKSRSNLRTRHIKGQFVKPLSSLESCLMVQLYKEHKEIDDYVYSVVQSPRTPTTKPFIVTDGRRIISRASGNSSSLLLKSLENQLQKNTYSLEDTIHGVPQLPKIGHMNFQRKAIHKSGENQVERSSNSSGVAEGKHQNIKGSSHGALLFCLGISVGIMSSLLANQREVDKLNELLKQSENLVQDLQEEIEMKDSLTVKELTVQDYDSQDTHNNSFYEGHIFSPDHKLDESTEHQHSIYHAEDAEENSLSKIEAELEAELERLELSMNMSGLDGKLTDLVELDPDFVPDVAVGELRADYFGRQAGAQPYADQDGSGSSTTHFANYAVSPRELSLRLHEVIQSRLEERVKELETALQNSQRKVQYMEYEHINSSWRNFSSSEAGSLSTQGSPLNKGEQPCADHPVVINLSGEAVDAYNEVYDLFTKINDSEEDQPSGSKTRNNGKCWQPYEQSPCQFQNGWINTCTRSHSGTLHGQPSGVHNYRGEDADNTTLPIDIGISGHERDDSNDEMEKLLIKHIVEKARKGSAVVLNAQRALFSKDEN